MTAILAIKKEEVCFFDWKKVQYETSCKPRKGLFQLSFSECSVCHTGKEESSVSTVLTKIRNK